MQKLLVIFGLIVLLTACAKTPKTVSEADAEMISRLDTYQLSDICGDNMTLAEAVPIARSKCNFKNEITQISCGPSAVWAIHFQKDIEHNNTEPYGCSIYKDGSAEILYGGYYPGGATPKREIIP